MTITLDKVGKRFNKEWIFRHLDLRINPQDSLAITGPNGSGKSTLLQIISGSLIPSEGEVCFENKKNIDKDDIYKYVAMAAPYLDIIEEFTLKEFLSFHFGFKRIIENASLKDLPELFQLAHAANKPIKNFSTGMRQRVKLGICFYSDVPVVLLDEPTSNLDKNGVKWYREQIDYFLDKKCILISSNTEHEYDFCKRKIDIMRYKKLSLDKQG